MSVGPRLVATAAVAGGAFAIAVGLSSPAADSTGLVTLPASSFDYRLAGEFLRDSTPVNPPLARVSFERPVEIMTRHVSRTEYQRCVDAGACEPVAAPMLANAALVAAVGVSWYDANDYAAWLSRETGHRYRLPTDPEWAYAAATLFRDNTVVEDSDPDNPASRWIAIYDSQAASDRDVESSPQPFGTYGPNENGLVDLAGNVWDWTSTCFSRNSVAGDETSVLENCGVRVVEGAHRTYLSDFVRDPRGGGCSVGTPPRNLGIRLVRDGDASLVERIVGLLSRRPAHPSDESRLSLL